jgi:hypothetical protein
MASNGERLWQNSGRVRGYELNSYRAEATGMLSWLKFIQEFTRFNKVKTRCKVVLYCENLSLVEEVQYMNTLAGNRDALKLEFDLLIAILCTRRELQQRAPGLEQARHVKGHQDNTTRYEDLSPQAQLNVDADKMATEAMREVLEREKEIPVTENPHCKAYVVNDTKVWTQAESELLRWKRHVLELAGYHMTEMKKDELTLHLINCPAWVITQRNMGIRERKYAIKLTTGWLPTGTRLEK